jgi:hypothetical protein
MFRALEQGSSPSKSRINVLANTRVTVLAIPGLQLVVSGYRLTGST